MNERPLTKGEALHDIGEDIRIIAHNIGMRAVACVSSISAHILTNRANHNAAPNPGEHSEANE